MYLSRIFKFYFWCCVIILKYTISFDFKYLIYILFFVIFIIYVLIMIETSEKLHIIWTQDTEWLVMGMVSILKKNLTELGYDIAKVLSYEINTYNEFADEETTIWELESSVRWKHVWVVIDVNGKKIVRDKNLHPIIMKYNDRLVQALFLGNAAEVHWWKTLNYISTSLFYGREDKFPDGGLKETTKRSSTSAHFFLDVVLDQLAPDYYVTMDVHNKAVFKGNKVTKCVNLHTWRAVQRAIQDINKHNILLSGMDQWWDKKIEAISEDLWLDYINVIKRRSKKENNKVEEIIIVGDTTGRDVLIHDDILDTGGSFVALVEKMRAEWKPNSVNAVITAGLFNGTAIEKLIKLHEKWMIDTIYVTNSVYRETYPSFVKIFDAAPNYAEVIEAAFTNRSINFNMWVNTIK